jgi:hypothetical protein
MKLRARFSSSFLTVMVLAIFGFCTYAAEIDSPRERSLLDSGWKFYLGNPWGDVLGLAKADDNRGPAKPDFSDADWRTIDLPHDWAATGHPSMFIEQQFDQNSPPGNKPARSAIS